MDIIASVLWLLLWQRLLTDIDLPKDGQVSGKDAKTMKFD